jgi:hypothetical protein
MFFERVSDSLKLDAETNRSLVHDNASTAALIRDIIRYLESLGAKIHPSSRLHQYALLFEGNDDTSVATLDQALLEVLQFLAIARAFKLSADTHQWIRLLCSASSGHVDSKADRFDPRARSAQFELFTMACLTAAGFRVDALEPDLWARIGDVDVAFAAKRLRSVGKLDRNLRDAQRQISRQRTSGFIVVDLSFVELISKPLYVPRLEQQQAIAAIVTDGFAKQHERTLSRAAAEPYVLGVLLHASVIGRSVEPVSRFVSRRWLLCAANDSSTSRQLAAAIQELGRKPWGPVQFNP